MGRQRSRFDQYVRQTIEEVSNYLREYNLLDQDRDLPDLNIVEQEIRAPNPDWTSGVSYAIETAPTIATGYEYIGEFEKALQYYRLGTYAWPYPWPVNPAESTEDSYGRRGALARLQLRAAICADRVGETERARNLYEWAAKHYKVTAVDIEYFTQTNQFQAIWEYEPFCAFSLACLGKWKEALSIGEEALHWVQQDARAQTTESHQTPLKILPVILALSNYKVQPNDDNRLSAQRMLDPQAVTSRDHANHLLALFYLYNLHARHPDLANPPDDELSPAVRARQGADACKKWMVSAGITLDGTTESLKYLDQNIRSLFQATSDEQEKKTFLFLWGSYFGEVATP